MINAIDLNVLNETEYINDIGGELKFLSNVKNINVFVGENNCGKSRFLRSLIKSDSSIYLSDSMANRNDYSFIRSRLKTVCEELHAKEPCFVVSYNHDSLSPCELYVFYQNQFVHFGFDKKDYSYPHFQIVKKIKDDLVKLYDWIVCYEDSQRSRKKTLRKVYIPVLRGVECFSIYFDRDKNIY